MKKIVFFLLAAPLFFACSSDDDDNGQAPTQEYVLLSQMTVGTGPGFANEVTTFYQYDGRKLLSTSDSNGNFKNYQYNGTNRISKIESYISTGLLVATETFLYDQQGRVIQNRVISGGTGERHVFTYNSNGTVEVRSYTGTDQVQNNDEVIRILTFTDNEMTEMDYTNVPLGTMTYTYDDKFKPTRNIIGFESIAHTITNARDRKGAFHNVLTEVRAATEDAAESTTTKTYTYDAAGYPLTQQSTSDISANTYRVEYEYITVNL